ncbi:prostaglandin reductase 1-like [Saccoglossus kowalevskii]|uniref:Prostaglandin reductase 1 n=1 Tax=Saccoglossus kowalevskii TaxID=10224 RepID=A0ABM0GK83_SACKO|nr:PREDICTED: prostaglandin reductase 1-like [Saccoglossus kowalevskii]
MVKAKKFILAKHFDGFPKNSDLKLLEEELPELQDGQFLLEAIYLSVDPYMRPYSRRLLKEGDVMLGQQLAKVIQSRNTNYATGSHVLTTNKVGWRSHTISRGGQDDIESQLEHYPAQIPLCKAMGILGMVGMTSYFGFIDICTPKEGETVVVNGAAGAVGSIVGQIAKIKGCRVIGFAGSDNKVKYLKDLGFDEAFNYKTIDLDETLKLAAPNGVDIYFDNVGGKFSEVVRKHMRKYGRISCCGAISQYNKQVPDSITSYDMLVVIQELKIQGFIVSSYKARYPEAFKQIAEWYLQGKINLDETITDGFENMPKAFFGLFTGDNIGKALVKT